LNNESINLKKLANCIRFLSIDAVQKANSGHPGMPMGMADIVTVLFKDHLVFDPKDPNWINRDRFIVSNGHGSMLLYASLFLSGYRGIKLNDIKNFRQLGSPTAGHPEYKAIEGIETTTGPLSQGLSNAVGIALAERLLNKKFGDKLIDHKTYVFAGDGCLMEGLSHEACSFAGHINLSNLIVFFDDNSISIDGPTNLSVSDNHIKRFNAYGWNTFKINGHNFKEISNAIIKAKLSKKPCLICCKTKIGYGSPNKESSASSHGSPLGEEEVSLTRKKLNWNFPPFTIPKNLIEQWRSFSRRNKKNKDRWNRKFKEKNNNKKINDYFNNKISNEINKKIHEFKFFHFRKKTNCATRKASEMSLEIFTNYFNNLIGGSADLTGSNNTKPKNLKTISKNKFDGNYIYYGVREHAMAGIMNGISLHSKIRPYGGTFLVFTDYCRPSIRLAALMNLPVIYVMTHDSIGLGEDGPTHQPVEHLASLRSIPNLNVIRPCDTIETIEAWQNALENTKTPTVIVLSRQNMPLVRNNLSNKNLLERGAYTIVDYKKYHATILASGSEVHIALDSSKKLKKIGVNVRVVSFPSWELFNKQTAAYQRKILGNAEIFGIEAGIINGWEKYIKKEENFIGMKSFGLSGPYKDLYKHFGITSDKMSLLIKKILK
tara:strand:- start:12754 stop:14730 length:1977 start_codon:yes stop_codon:yes gene_type:complete